MAAIVGAVGLPPKDLQAYHMPDAWKMGEIKLLSSFIILRNLACYWIYRRAPDVFNQMWVMANPDSFGK